MEFVDLLMTFAHLIMEENSKVTFLDLDISISNGKISTKLYDKRDHIFFIVLMPDLHGNISSYVFLCNFDVRGPSCCNIIFFCYILMAKSVHQ